MARDNPMSEYLERFPPPENAGKDEEAAAPGAAAAELRSLLAMAPQASLDLHGLDREQAARAVEAFLVESRARGLRKVLIIHGKGMHAAGPAVLPRLVRQLLEAHPAAGRFGAAERRLGGSGATWVVLREAGAGGAGGFQRSR